MYVWRSNRVENQWSVTPLIRVQVQPLNDLLIQYEVQKLTVVHAEYPMYMLYRN